MVENELLVGGGFCRFEDGQLSWMPGPGGSVYRCPAPYAFISSLRWWPETSSVLMTATPQDGRVPGRDGAGQGDLNLFRWSPPESAEWTSLYRGYAHDPVGLDRERIAAHRGAGLVFLDESGHVQREHKVGRFNWGPPSLSASPNGELVAWIRWKGDDKRLCVESPTGEVSKEFRTSVYRYLWLSEETIVYYLGGLPRALEVSTGATRALFSAKAARRDADVPEEVLAYLALSPGDYATTLGGIAVQDELVWFSAGFFAWQNALPPFGGLFTARTDGTGWKMIETAPEPGRRLENFDVLSDGSRRVAWAAYVDGRLIDRTHTYHGASADLLRAGWQPLPTSSNPEFGFHQIPH